MATSQAPAAREVNAVDVAICRAVQLMFAGAHADAARLVDDALANAPAGNAGWLLPLEPLLRVTASPGIWAQALTRLRTRAA